MPNPTETRLLRLLAYFENGAASIRATLAFVKHDPLARNGNGHANGVDHPAMAAALELDATRRGRAAVADLQRASDATIKRTRSKGHTAEKLARRAETAKVLERFDTSEARTPADAGVDRRGISTLVRWGYLKRKGPAILRTSKPFAVDWREE